MSKMATARIPDEIYNQGVQRLTHMGLGTTDLIRAAFEYLAQTGELPQVPSKPGAVERTLSAQQRQVLKVKMAASRLVLTLPDDWDYRDQLAEGKWADYEALA